MTSNGNVTAAPPPSPGAVTSASTRTPSPVSTTSRTASRYRVSGHPPKVPTTRTVSEP